MLLFGAIAFLSGVPAGPDELHARIRDDGDRIRETMLARFTQTNEPARCAALLTGARRHRRARSASSRWGRRPACASIPTATATSSTAGRSARAARST